MIKEWLHDPPTPRPSRDARPIKSRQDGQSGQSVFRSHRLGWVCERVLLHYWWTWLRDASPEYFFYSFNSISLSERERKKKKGHRFRHRTERRGVKGGGKKKQPVFGLPLVPAVRNASQPRIRRPHTAADWQPARGLDYTLEWPQLNKGDAGRTQRAKKSIYSSVSQRRSGTMGRRYGGRRRERWRTEGGPEIKVQGGIKGGVRTKRRRQRPDERREINT